MILLFSRVGKTCQEWYGGPLQFPPSLFCGYDQPDSVRSVKPCVCTVQGLMKILCLDQSCIAIAQGTRGIGWLQRWAQKLERAAPTASFPHFICGNFRKILMFEGFVVGRFSWWGEVEGLSFTGNRNLELSNQSSDQDFCLVPPSNTGRQFSQIIQCLTSLQFHLATHVLSLIAF